MTELLELNGNERLRSVQLRLSKLRLLAGLSAEVFSVEILGLCQPPVRRSGRNGNLRIDMDFSDGKYKRRSMQSSLRPLPEAPQSRCGASSAKGTASDCLKGKEGQLQRSIRARKINDRQITRISAQLFLCR